MFTSKLFAFYKKIPFEIFDALKNTPDNLREDIIKIKYFLQNKPVILVALSGLELALRKTLIVKNIDYNQFINSTDKKDYKVLSDTLKLWLQQTAFSQYVPKITNFLSVTSFFAQLRNKELFKDIGSGLKHGEWSHFIQWYLICNSDELRNALTSPPETIYALLGTQSSNSFSIEGETLWDFTVDLLSENTLYEDFDFSFPEYIIDFLIKEKNTYPTLSTCINKRMKKRIDANKTSNNAFESSLDQNMSVDTYRKLI